MTARTVETAPALRPYPIDQTWKRGGYYVARLTGPDPKYGVGREFLKGSPVKRRGTVEYGLKAIGEVPGWILRRPVEPCPTCSQTRPVRDTGEDLIAAYASGWVDLGRVFGTVDLLAVHAAGPPGTPGAWAGDRCRECAVTPVFAHGGRCAGCDEVETNRASLAVLPNGEVF